MSEWVSAHIGDIPNISLENSELPFNVETNNFSDLYLSENLHLETLFAIYAGVEPGDDTKKVII